MTALADIHCNGFAGVDFNDAAIDADALDHALHVMLRTGVTQVFPTLITASQTALRDRLLALDRAVAHARLGAMVAGFHLEGPFLNPGASGCHPPGAMRDPDPLFFDRLATGLRTPVRLMTLAPELPGALALIGHLRARGTAVALGHTLARAEHITAAAEAGATLSTHLGNALPSPVHKTDNPIMAQLAEDRLVATLIADGSHLTPSTLRIYARAKTLRIALVTDATAASAATPGTYQLSDIVIHRDDVGDVWDAHGTRAGSSLTLDAAIRNAAKWGLGPIHEVRAYATGVAAGIVARGTVTWSEDGHVVQAALGDVTVRPH